jgi:ElaB/YqjD/DUF883 family membrane-anchored ribosome-binding protein
MNRTSSDEQHPHAQTNASANEEGERKGRRPRREEREHEENRNLDVARLREVGRNLVMQVEQQARKRPYVALGAAAGIGFVAGSLFGSRLGQVLLAAGVGYAARNILDGDVGIERLQENFEKLAHERARS